MSEIADIFVASLATLSFKDRLEGETYPLVKNVNNVVKTFPVALHTPTTCDASRYVDLVPNSTKKSVIYLEKGATSVDEENKHYTHLRESWRLVCWINTKLCDYTEITAYPYMQELYSLLPENYGNSGKYINLFFHFTGVVTDKSIFSEYSYSEVEKQYLIHPFVWFAMDFDVTYWWRKACMEPVPSNPTAC